MTNKSFGEETWSVPIGLASGKMKAWSCWESFSLSCEIWNWSQQGGAEQRQSSDAFIWAPYEALPKAVHPWGFLVSWALFLLELIRFVCVCVCVLITCNQKSPTQYRAHDKIHLYKDQSDGGWFFKRSLELSPTVTHLLMTAVLCRVRWGPTDPETGSLRASGELFYRSKWGRPRACPPGHHCTCLVPLVLLSGYCLQPKVSLLT